MTRYDTTARRAAGAAALLAAAGLALAGCKSSTSAAGSSTSPAAASSSASATASASASTSAGTQTSTFFPVGVNNTWVYATKVGGKPTSDITNKMIAVDPVAGGQQVTMSIDPGTSTPTTVAYIFHPDGSITVPVSQFGNGTVKLTSGSIVWPDQAELNSGTPHTSTLSFTVTTGGNVTHLTAHVTVKGEGVQSVTVPAGTYQAQLINEDLAETVAGVPVTFTLQTWVATGVGPVKSTLTAGSTNSLQGTIEELKSFTKGSS
jgi:hypothetical protein